MWEGDREHLWSISPHFKGTCCLLYGAECLSFQRWKRNRFRRQAVTARDGESSGRQTERRRERGNCHAGWPKKKKISSWNTARWELPTMQSVLSPHTHLYIYTFLYISPLTLLFPLNLWKFWTIIELNNRHGASEKHICYHRYRRALAPSPGFQPSDSEHSTFSLGDSAVLHPSCPFFPCFWIFIILSMKAIYRVNYEQVFLKFYAPICHDYNSWKCTLH